MCNTLTPRIRSRPMDVGATSTPLPPQPGPALARAARLSSGGGSPPLAEDLSVVQEGSDAEAEEEEEGDGYATPLSLSPPASPRPESTAATMADTGGSSSTKTVVSPEASPSPSRSPTASRSAHMSLETSALLRGSPMRGASAFASTTPARTAERPWASVSFAREATALPSSAANTSARNSRQVLAGLASDPALESLLDELPSGVSSSDELLFGAFFPGSKAGSSNNTAASSRRGSAQGLEAPPSPPALQLHTVLNTGAAGDVTPQSATPQRAETRRVYVLGGGFFTGLLYLSSRDVHQVGLLWGRWRGWRCCGR